MDPSYTTIDGNEAVARVAYRLNEVLVLFPITPSSPVGEWRDAWATEGQPNSWGTAPPWSRCKARQARRGL